MAKLKLILNEIPDYRKEEANIFLLLYQSLRDGCLLSKTELVEMRNFAQKRIEWCIVNRTEVYNKKDTL